MSLTSAQRDENRLTDDDRRRIDERLAELAAEAKAEGHAIREHERDRFTRVAAFAIGCHPSDLRASELAEIDRRITAVLYT